MEEDIDDVGDLGTENPRIGSLRQLNVRLRAKSKAKSAVGQNGSCPKQGHDRRYDDVAHGGIVDTSSFEVFQLFCRAHVVKPPRKFPVDAPALIHQSAPFCLFLNPWFAITQFVEIFEDTRNINKDVY